MSANRSGRCHFIFLALFLFGLGWIQSSSIGVGITALNPVSESAIYLGIATDRIDRGGEIVGGNINILNGNVMIREVDIRIPSAHAPGLGFTRFYNSAGPSDNKGWSHTYSVVLFAPDTTDTRVRIVDETGRAHFFSPGAGSVFNEVFQGFTQVQVEGSLYVWYRLDGRKYGFSAAGRLQWIDDPAGNRLSLAYDSSGKLLTVSDSSSERSLGFAYDSSSRLSAITGPVTAAVSDGVWARYAYATNPETVSVTYADGSGYTYAYQGQLITSRSDMEGHQLNSWGYNDSLSRCTSSTTRDGTGCQVAYTSSSLVSVTDSYGTQRSYTISSGGSVCRVTEMSGTSNAPYSVNNAVRWAYDSSGRLTEIRYGGGRIDRFSSFDSRGNPADVTLGAGDEKERHLTFTYHPSMNLPLSRREPSILSSGGVKETIFDFDSSGDGTTPNQNPSNLCYRVIENGFTTDSQSTIIPYHYVTSFSYNSKGQVISRDGPLPGTDDLVTFSYESSTGNLQSITYPVIGAVQFSDYDAAGFPGRKTDVNNQADRFAYDGRGRPTVTTHLSDSSTTSVSYTLSGEIYHKIDEDLVGQTLAYDPASGLLTSLSDQTGNTIVYAYDSQGNIIQKDYFDTSSTLTRRERRTYQHPDYPGLLYRETLSDDTYSQYTYDGAGNVVAFRAPSGNITSFGYDVFGRKTSMTQPGGATTAYAYDARGSLASLTTPEGYATSYVHDDMGRVVAEASPEHGTTTYSYDSAGKLAGRTDARGITLTYTYDALSRPLTATSPAYPSRGIANPLAVSFAYDQGTYGKGHLTGFSDPSGSTAYTYDARGRVGMKSSTVSNYTHSISQTLSAAGRLTSLAYPSGRTVDYAYGDCACRIQDIHTTFSGTTLSVVENLAYAPFSGAKSMGFGSGGAVSNVTNLDGRLLFANQGKPKERSYTYDADGRLKTVTVSATPWFNRTFDYDSLGQLSHAEGPFGSLDYFYDNAGNRLLETRGDTSSAGAGVDVVFGYNQPGELSSVQTSTGDPVAAYAYNAMGQRVQKVTASFGTTGYFYDFQGNLLFETDSDGSITREYIYRGNSRAGFIENGKLYYFHNDTSGNPILVTDASKTVVWEGLYEPFGKTSVNARSTIENNFRFQGQYYDKETGLHYNFRRYYDPEIGRYITPDPIGLAGGINLYAYAQNNPTNFVDYLGLQPNNDPDRGQWGPVTNAVVDFITNYQNMREANTIGADKYFHCMANCQAAKEGPVGKDIASGISEAREQIDEHIKGDLRVDCDADRAANEKGRSGNPDDSCRDTCASLRPNGLDPKY